MPVLLSPMVEASLLGSTEREKELEREPKALGGSRVVLLLFMPASMYRVELAADCTEGEWELTDDVLEWLLSSP